VLWFAYPKQTSKRTEPRKMLAGAGAGLQANRQIAVDNDWSALRFKKSH
jgi:hypothetical protein